MTARCPRCATVVDLSRPAADGRVYCPGCADPVGGPPAVAAAPANPFAFDDDPPAGRPVLVPVAVGGGPPELIREQVADLRDRREDRRERRHQDREDRASNPLGVAGAAVTGTALLLVVSGALFASSLRGYGWVAAVFGLLGTLVGLPLSIVGAVRPGRQRAVAVAGAAAGGLLLLVLVPALMVYLSNLK